jgi:hypothetical protein
MLAFEAERNEVREAKASALDVKAKEIRAEAKAVRNE